MSEQGFHQGGILVHLPARSTAQPAVLPYLQVCAWNCSRKGSVLFVSFIHACRSVTAMTSLLRIATKLLWPSLKETLMIEIKTLRKKIRTFPEPSGVWNRRRRTAENCSQNSRLRIFMSFLEVKISHNAAGRRTSTPRLRGRPSARRPGPDTSRTAVPWDSGALCWRHGVKQQARGIPGSPRCGARLLASRRRAEPRPAAVGRTAPAHARCGGSVTVPQPWRTRSLRLFGSSAWPSCRPSTG